MDRTLLRIVDLPTNDLSEMQSMVELQVDKFSPFPVEHMAVAFEVLAQRENGSRVLIAAVQRDLINAVGAAFQKVGAWPERLDLDILGWWALLKEREEFVKTGLFVAVRVETGGTWLIICDHGLPVIMRALGGSGGLSEDEYYEEIANEVGYSLATVEAEFGVAGGVRVGVWRSGPSVPPRVSVVDSTAAPEPDALLPRLSEVCGGAEVHAHRLEEMPPISEGLARRAVTDGLLLNLAPAEWRAAEQRNALKKSLIAATTAFSLLWLAALGAFSLQMALTRRRLGELKTAVAALETPAAEVRDLSAKVRSFEQYADRSHSAIEALREITLLLPQGVELTSFSFRKGETVNLRGIADYPEPIYDFFQALERSDFFVKVEPGDIRSKIVGGTPKSEFSVTAALPGGRKETS